MILAIDIGNSNIVLGCFDEQKIVFTERVSTDLRKTELEYAIVLRTVLELHRIPADSLEGAVISSVVPPLVQVMRNAIAKIFPAVHVVEATSTGPGPIPLILEHPEQVGTDLVANAAAADDEYGAPAIIIDLGTATTISVIDEYHCYVGGAILPGVQLSLQSLVSGTAQLPNISLTRPSHVLGKNTVDSMRSGVIFGNAAAIDGMIDRICKERDFKDPVLLAVGDAAEAVIPCCRHRITIDPDLPLKGLRILYDFIMYYERHPEEVPHASDD